MGFAFRSPNADFACLVHLRRNAGMSLAFCIYGTDSCSNFLSLLSTCALPLSTFGIPVMLDGLLGTPGNLELRKRTGLNGLNISNGNLAGLVRYVDAGVTCDVVSHDILFASRV